MVWHFIVPDDLQHCFALADNPHFLAGHHLQRSCIVLELGNALFQRRVPALDLPYLCLGVFELLLELLKFGKPRQENQEEYEYDNEKPEIFQCLSFNANFRRYISDDQRSIRRKSAFLGSSKYFIRPERPGVNCLARELLFDAQELVVFCNAVCP